MMVATWDDPAVSWNSDRYSWVGDLVLTTELQGNSVFAHVEEDRPFVRITDPRYFARP